MEILRKYGEATTIFFPLVNAADSDFNVAATFAAGDCKIAKDEGAEANTNSTPADEGSFYSLALTATEMQAARIAIVLIDQTATKVWKDTAFLITTYGNASAQHEFDLDDGTPTVNVTQISGAAVSTTTAQIGTNVVQVSGDATAADNIELDYDGTGYAKTNSTIGTATNVTNQVTADTTAISGDTVAANNLEAAFDGTGYDDGGVNRLGANVKEVNQTAVTDQAGVLDVNVAQISADATAATNLEADYDGTGYAKTNSTVGTATNVTNQVTADVTAISGSTAAADNLEAWWANMDTQINVASATTTTIVFDDAAMNANNDFYNGMIVFVYGGTGAGQARLVTDYDGGTKSATVFPAWGTTPDATSDVIMSAGPGVGADMSETDVSMYGTVRNLPEVLNVLATLMRNEINVDSNSIDVRNDGDSSNLFAYTISDDGSTFTHAKGA
jgi:hypothetical protein